MMKVEDFFIYALLDPYSCIIRYIGLSSDIEMRFRQHNTEQGGNYQKSVWLKGLHDAHQFPIMEILDRAKGIDSARRKEAFWLSLYHRRNTALTNIHFPPFHVKPGTLPSFLVEFDMPVDKADWFVRLLEQDILDGEVSIYGMRLFSSIGQVAISVYSSNDAKWAHIVRKWGRRALMDRLIHAYRYCIDDQSCDRAAFDWAVFGDEQFLQRRLQQTFAQRFDTRSRPFGRLIEIAGVSANTAANVTSFLESGVA